MKRSRNLNLMLLALIGAMVLFTGPEENGQRKIGKEIVKMIKFKSKGGDQVSTAGL